MQRELFAGMALTAVDCLFLSQPILAYDGAAGSDMEKVVAMKGPIADFEWANPRSRIYFNLTEDKSKVARWVAEREPPAVMSESGWARKSIKTEDRVPVYCFVAKNGAMTSILQKIVLPDGKKANGRGGNSRGL
jgi:hypothetical protein